MKQFVFFIKLWLIALPLFASWPEYFNSSAKEPENQAQKVIDDTNPREIISKMKQAGYYLLKKNDYLAHQSYLIFSFEP